MLIHWIWLATRPGLSDRVKVAVLQHFHDPEDVYYADADAYALLEDLTADMVASLKDKSLQEAQKILEQCEDKQIRLLTYGDTLYPNRLKNIADPPLVLYYVGNMPEFDAYPVISIVGTRKATPYGMNIAKRMGTQIARCGGLVVSGAATGIDAMAMAGALQAGKRAVAILGCGVDVVYPLNNRSLLLDTQSHGCVISEFPPETPPYRWNFPKRNRIISGLSNGVLVVEAPERSGALITANQAAEQGRDVFVIPGNVDVAACAGSNALLREGAIAVSTGWDVLSEYQSLFPDKIHKDEGPALQDHYREEEAVSSVKGTALSKVAQRIRFPKKEKADRNTADKKDIDIGNKAPYSDLNKKEISLTPEERSVLELLGKGEYLVDDLIAESNLPSGTVLSTMTMLEIKGLILRLPGRRVRLSGQKP